MKAKQTAFRILAPALAAALGLSAAAHAADYEVTVGSDDGTGNTANTLSWAIRSANVAAGADTITLKTDVTITGVMKRLIDGAPSGGDHDSGGGDLAIQSDATRRTISGNNQFRPLFVKSGTVTIQNLNLINGKAKGGDSVGGGGGAGLGGALFVYGGTVTVRNVAFTGNTATGGGSVFGVRAGGGGMFGNGNGTSGGGGLFANNDDGNGGYGGYSGYGGYGGSGYGSNGGFGGGGAKNNFGPASYAGSGGFGGGGGAGGWGGNGGFGGGGGYGKMTGGNGGFGGGGAGWGSYGSGPGSGGFGGGNGSGEEGGGGAGFGGAVFAMKGTVILSDVSFSGNTVTAGAGANNGTAAGGDIFICTAAAHDPLCGATVRFCGSTATNNVVGTPEIPVCGCGRDLPSNTWLMTAPACPPSPPSITSQYGDDLSGTYETNWIAYGWEANAYAPQADIAPLVPGFGSWLYSTSAGTLDLSGTATPTEPCSNYGSGLSGQCFVIDLVIPPSGARRWNMVGHPFPYPVGWDQVRVATAPDSVTWTQRTPSQAAADNIMAKEQWRWNGSSYQTSDDATPGSIGTLQPQEAVWVRSLPAASTLAGMRLLIPAR